MEDHYFASHVDHSGIYCVSAPTAMRKCPTCNIQLIAMVMTTLPMKTHTLKGKKMEMKMFMMSSSPTIKNSTTDLSIEARNCAVVDSGCSSTVCGHAWFNFHVNSLSREERKKIIELERRKTFKFGGGKKQRS